MTQKIWMNVPKARRKRSRSGLQPHTNETANAERELKAKVGARQMRKMAKAYRREHTCPPLTPETLKRGGRYNWKNQPDRLIYLRKFNGWHQFQKIGDPREVWCEVPDSDLHMLEETML